MGLAIRRSTNRDLQPGGDGIHGEPAKRLHHRAAGQRGNLLRTQVDRVRGHLDGTNGGGDGVPVCSDLSGYIAAAGIGGSGLGGRSQVSGVRCQVSGLRCQVSGVRSQVSGLRCQVSGLRCQVSGVRCEVSGLRFQASVLGVGSREGREPFLFLMVRVRWG